MPFYRGLSALVLAVSVTACFGNSASEFPPGLEPLEANTAPTQAGTPTETLVMVDGTGYVPREYLFVHGRGYVKASPGAVWAIVKDGNMLSSSCRFNAWTVTENVDPAYEYSFRVSNTVEDLITIDWDEEWRFGTIDGTPENPELAIARSQKVYGSIFIYLIEGSLQVQATDDPEITEIEIIQHLAAYGGDASDMQKTMQRQFDSVVELTHGRPQPACP